MADPITTILTTAAEHAPSTAAVTMALKAAKDFLTKVTGPAVGELGEIGRDYVKGWRAKNGNAVLAGADKLLAEAGREPQTVPLKVLLPLLDAASLEGEPTLAELWSILLANAADPAQRVAVQPSFAEILRQLTPLDAQVFDYMYHNRAQLTVTEGNDLVKVLASQMTNDLKVPLADLGVSIDNLQRLWLCSRPNTLGGTVSLHINNERYALMQTLLGQLFYAAVTPPAP